MADLRTTLQARLNLAMQKAKMMLDTAEREARSLTPAEEEAHAAILVDIEAVSRRFEKLDSDDAQRAEIERLTNPLVGGNGNRGRANASMSLGAEFMKSETFAWLKKHAHSRPSGAWSSPASELTATTLSEDAGSGGPVVVPQIIPGVLPLPMKPLRVAQLFAQGTTDSNALTFMREKTFTNAAASVAEGAAKPESTLVFEAVTTPVQKYAHWLPVTDEMLEDHAALVSYLNARLALGVDLAVDTGLLNGTGAPPDLAGLLGLAGLTAAHARGADNNADAILKEIIAVELATNLPVDAIVMNPANWQTILLTKDANGQYYGSGPFANPQSPTLWGRPVALTTAIVANTALVGAFQSAAQIFRRGGMRVEASNSHSDYFIKNLVAIRAEARLALAVYRAAAFGTVTGLT